MRLESDAMVTETDLYVTVLAARVEFLQLGHVSRESSWEHKTRQGLRNWT